MGRQAKLKAERRAIRQQIKRENEKIDTKNPPDLGVSVGDGINTNDIYGKQ